ncbi:MAG: hypothetical protein IJO76_00740 [Clostridia bacterium]|nr:hypothetical protein [Clostridia bacterium]
MKIYAFPVDPEKYPAFAKRINKVVTREALGNKIHFSGPRYFKHTDDYKTLYDMEETIRDYTEDYDVGDCFWLNNTTLLADNKGDMVRLMAEKGLYLYGFWGLGGNEIPYDSNVRDFGDVPLPDEFHQLMESVLGDHFLGYEMGEGDGWYIGSFISRQDSAKGEKNRLGQYKAFEEYFEPLAKKCHSKMTILCALPTVHYYAKDGFATILSCEAAQSLPNPQMWYAFIRGASKQYGILTAGNASVWNAWGYKTYESSGSKDDPLGWGDFGPEEGTSLSLLKRILYAEYMYGCEFLGYETSYFTDDNSERSRMKQPSSTANVPIFGKLSPLGHITQYANRLMNKIDRPGGMYTPLAVMIDTFAGWLPPRYLYTSSLYQAWGNLPYNTGDHQLHTLFSMLYPGYENSGFYQDERGFLTATPYGEIADVLLSDADGAVLNRYPMALLLSDTTLTYELFDKLRTYVTDGGHVVLFADTVRQYADKLAPYADISAFFGVDAFTGETEAEGLTVLTATLTPDATVEAAAGDLPLLITRPAGAGKATVVLAKDGLVSTEQPLSLSNNRNEDIVTLYDFAPFLKDYLDSCFRDFCLVKPTNEALEYIVTVQDETHLRVLVTNNTHTAQSYDLVGDIAAVEEISLDDGSPAMVGYYPKVVSVDNTTAGGEGTYTVPALEMQMFTVTLNSPLELAAESNPAPRRVKTAVKMPTGYATAKDFLLEHPSFSQYFDTLTVSGEYLLRMDKAAAEKEAFYLHQTGVKLSLDLLSLSNLCPDLDVNPLYPAKQERTYKMVDDMLDKLFLYDADSVYTTWIRPAYGTEVHQQKPAIKALWAHIVRRCGANGVQAVCQNRPLTLSPDAMFSLAQEVAGLELGLNTCGAILACAEPADLTARYGVRHFLLSAPHTDRLGQVYNAYAPVAPSDSAASLRQLVETTATADSTVYFAATYEDWNQIYADYKAIF